MSDSSEIVLKEMEDNLKSLSKAIIGFTNGISQVETAGIEIVVKNSTGQDKNASESSKKLTT